MAWTPERKSLALRLWSEGNSAKRIAAILGGTTRNAVIGLAHRAGAKQHFPLEAGGQPSTRSLDRDDGAVINQQPAPPPLSVRLSAQNVSRRGDNMKGLEPFPCKGKEPVELKPEIAVDPVCLLDLEPHHCRWPVGKLFCGAQKVRRSYCQKHYNLGHQTKSSSWAADDPRRAQLAQARRLYYLQKKAYLSGSH
jgi:hypothetical protein